MNTIETEEYCPVCKKRVMMIRSDESLPVRQNGKPPFAYYVYQCTICRTKY